MGIANHRVTIQTEDKISTNFEITSWGCKQECDWWHYRATLTGDLL